MATEIVRGGEESKAKETKGITFKCRFCGRSRPLDEMMVLTRFFPPIVAYRDCEKKVR